MTGVRALRAMKPPTTRIAVRLGAALLAVVVVVVGLCTQGHVAKPLPKPHVDDERKAVPVTFADLSAFDCATCTDHGAESDTPSLPESVKKLNGRSVSIAGFVLPVEYAEDSVSGIKRFLLTNSPMGGCSCGFGAAPRANEMIEVVMPDDRPAECETPYTPVVVTGVLDVGMHRVEGQGRLALLYHMSAPQVRSAPETFGK